MLVFVRCQNVAHVSSDVFVGGGSRCRGCAKRAANIFSIVGGGEGSSRPTKLLQKTSETSVALQHHRPLQKRMWKKEQPTTEQEPP